MGDNERRSLSRLASLQDTTDLRQAGKTDL
jgi:hypothetical protein